ncbi:PA14 domain-containing protein [Fervidicola ferrireducens]|nr:PA14 domain-containing protein [Fervidicola ferrireducens]
MSWSSVYPNVQYKIWFREAGGTWTSIGTTTSTSYTINNVSPYSKKYEVAISPVLPEGGTDWWYAVQASFMLDKPQLSYDSSLQYYQVKITMQPPASDPTASYSSKVFKLYRKTFKPDGNVEKDELIYTGTSNTFSTTDLTAGKYYSFRYIVEYRSSSGSVVATTPTSPEATFWTAPVANATAGTRSITLSWSSVYPGVNYGIVYRITGGQWTTAGTTAGLSYTINNLDPTKYYDVALYAANLPDGGNSWYTGANPLTLAPLAQTPSSVTVQSITQTSAQVTVDSSNPSGTKYTVWYKPASPFLADGSFSVSSGQHVGNPANTNAVKTQLGGGWNASTHYNACTIEIASEYGNKFLRFKSDGSGKWAGATANWSIKAGKWYRVTAWARTSSTTPISISNYAIYTGGLNPQLTWSNLKASDGWVMSQVVFQADQDRSGAIYLYGNQGSAGTTIDYDNIIIEEFDSNPGSGGPQGLKVTLFNTTSLFNSKGHPTNRTDFLAFFDPSKVTKIGETFAQDVYTVDPNAPMFGSLTDKFSAEYKGKIYAPVSGTYWFATDSDDASEIVIDGKVVASFYGGRGVSNTWDIKGSIYLEAGWHDFICRFEEGTGAQAARAGWMPPGQSSFTPIPAAAFGVEATAETTGTVTIQPLIPSTQYSVSAAALNVANIPSGYAATNFVTVPLKPENIEVYYGSLGWDKSAGRGWVKLEWDPVPNATGYKVWVFDGNTYRAFDVGNTTVWDSRNAKIYPPESELDSYGDNTVSNDIFKRGTGLDLRDTPNKLYKKTVNTWGNYDNANNYWFRVSAYNGSGDSGYSDNAKTPTLPNRTDTTAPTASIIINDGQTVAPGSRVKITVSTNDPPTSNYTSDSADDASGPMWVMFSNDGTNWSQKFLIDGGRNLVGTSGADPFFRSLAGWQPYGKVKPQIISSNEAQAGGSFVRLSWPDGPQYQFEGIDPAQFIQGIKPGQTYTVKIRYRLQNLTQSNVMLYFHWHKPDGSMIISDIAIAYPDDADGKWHEVVYQKTAPAGVDRLYIKIGITDPNKGTVLDVDYVQITSGENDPGIVDWNTSGVTDTFEWDLDTSGFGKKTVYAKVEDLAGNVSTVVSDDIFYYLVDAQAPNVSLKINDGATVTYTNTVRLTIDAKDDLTPADQLRMRFSNDFVNWTAWEKYQPYKDWALPGGDGEKAVYVQVQDVSGNIGTAYAKIVLKTSGGGTVQSNSGVFYSTTGNPGTITIDGRTVAVRFIKGSEVELRLNAPGVTEVRYSLDNAKWLPPEPASPVKTMTLPDWEGFKAVYVKLPDESVYVVRFVLDRTPPKLDAHWYGNATVTKNGSAMIIVDASDNFTPQDQLEYSLDKGKTWKPLTDTITVSFTGSGYVSVTLMVRDKAGNIATKTLGIFNF